MIRTAAEGGTRALLLVVLLATVPSVGVPASSGPASKPAPRALASDGSVGLPTKAADSFDLWSDGTRLRGANIHQRRVYPELDGRRFFGPGPLGPPYRLKDLRRLANAGANLVNISHPGLFGEEAPFAVDAKVRRSLDRLVGMAESAGLYVVISLRTGPGRSEFTFYTDGIGDWFGPEYLDDTVWSTPAAQAAWARMWRYTAERYRDSKAVVGYLLMVEPNSNHVGDDATDPFDIWEPRRFFRRYGGTTYDWNGFFPDIVAAIREVDKDTPVLVGGMAYSAVEWLPFVEPHRDPRMVYVVDQYAPFVYTHQDADAGGFTYPGRFDADGDGRVEDVDARWLESLFAPVRRFKARHGVPVAAAEYGLVRWAPGADLFLRDQHDQFERFGLNHAVWQWYPDWKPLRLIDEFNFRHGPDPDRHRDTVTLAALEQALRDNWRLNSDRPER